MHSLWQERSQPTKRHKRAIKSPGGGGGRCTPLYRLSMCSTKNGDTLLPFWLKEMLMVRSESIRENQIFRSANG